MILDITKLQKGDILLSYNKDNFISQEIAEVTHSSWSHALLYIGNDQIIESTGTGGGVKIENISKYQTDHYNIAILRIKPEFITPKQIDNMIESAKKDVGMK